MNHVVPSLRDKSNCLKCFKDIAIDLHFVFFKSSPSDTCHSKVGLWSVEGFIDRTKLLSVLIDCDLQIPIKNFQSSFVPNTDE